MLAGSLVATNINNVFMDAPIQYTAYLQHIVAVGVNLLVLYTDGKYKQALTKLLASNFRKYQRK